MWQKLQIHKGAWRHRMLRRRLLLGGTLVLLAMSGAIGCFRLHMYDQPRYEPLEASSTFENGQSARLPVAGTVARGSLKEDRHYYTGMQGDSVFTETFPFPVTMEVLERGRDRYNIFCTPCHDRVGTGRGMVVRRGFKQPTSYHDDRLRRQPAGYFFDVITNGFSTMPSYARQIPVQDRWAIVAYIRALQLSQYARVSDLPAAVRQRVEAGEGPAMQKEGETHH
jgi:hypothetical protein